MSAVESESDFIPRTVDGARLWSIGESAYAVVTDEAGREVSERHAGHFYVAFEGERAHCMFVDESGGRRSTFTLTRDGYGMAVDVFVDGENTWRAGALTSGRGHKGSTVDMNWGTGFDRMA